MDNHTILLKSGVVQLFTNPHPQKIVQSLYWNKIPPRLRSLSVDDYGQKLTIDGDEFINKSLDLDQQQQQRGLIDEEDDFLSSTIGTSTNASRVVSPLTFGKFLSRSRSSLPLVDDQEKIIKEKPNEQTIFLPKDFNPAAALIQVETMHNFINKISHNFYQPKISSFNEKNNQRQILATARLKEQQVLGCLIVEIFLADKFRAIWKIEKESFVHRLNANLNVIKTLSNNLMPKCVQNMVMLLLRNNALVKNIDFSESCDGRVFLFVSLYRFDF